MENERIAGALLRVLRLQRNWSQETLCHGICAVSYLSKIEQGKAHTTPSLCIKRNVHSCCDYGKISEN